MTKVPIHAVEGGVLRKRGVSDECKKGERRGGGGTGEKRKPKRTMKRESRSIIRRGRPSLAVVLVRET